MTHDQVREMVRRVNPVPDPKALEDVVTSVPVTRQERRTDMQTDDRVVTENGGPSRGRGPLVGIAAAVVVLVVGAIFLLTNDDPPVTTPAPNAAPLPATYDPMVPGAYYTDPDHDGASSVRGTFVIEEPGWSSLEPHGAEINDSVSLMVVVVEEVYTTACNTGQGPVAAESTTEGLANQFAATGFIVQEAVAPVFAFGYEGHHLVAEVPAGCADQADQVWNGGAWQGRYYQLPGEVVEWWFLDVEGTPVMVEATSYPEHTPEEDVTELRDVLDTLVITP